MTHRVGIIGLGVMGQRMLAAMDRHPEFDVTSIWDLQPEPCRKTNQTYPGVRVASSAENLVSDGVVDLVYIATPPSTHIPYSRLAFGAGKAIFCEKPLAVNLEESHALVEAIKASGVAHAVNFPFATTPAVLELEKQLQAEAHGGRRGIEIRFHFSEWPRTWQRDAAGWLGKRAEGGFLREVFSHFAYLTMRLVGPITVEQATVLFPPDDVSAEAYVMAKLKSNRLPIILTGGVGGAAPDYNAWTLYGAKKSFRLQDWSLAKVADPTRWYDLMPEAEPLPPLQQQLNALSNMLNGKPHPLPDFEVGLQVQEVVEGVLKQSSI